MGSHSILQGIFPTQGLKLAVLHCRQILYHLSRQGNPAKEKALGTLASVIAALRLSCSLQHVGSSQTRDQTHVPCIGRQILNP